MSRQRKITLGKRCGFLTVIEEWVKPNVITCKCDCGVIKDFSRINILAGRSKSCGCQQGQGAKLTNTTHGYTNTPTYNTWQAIHRRCYNDQHEHYKYYGAKGITVCDRWRKFENFLADMGPRPEGYELGRRSSKGPYCKENCKWQTHKENINNEDH